MAPIYRKGQSEKARLAALDKQLAHWAATDKRHKAEVARLEEKNKHDLDWFDHMAYQNMIYKGGWSK